MSISSPCKVRFSNLVLTHQQEMQNQKFSNSQTQNHQLYRSNSKILGQKVQLKNSNSKSSSQEVKVNKPLLNPQNQGSTSKSTVAIDKHQQSTCILT